MTALDRPLLVDTVAVVYWHADSPRLSPAARTAMLQAPERAVYVSAASAFEVATLVRLGKLTVPPPILRDFGYVVEADGFRLLDLDVASAIRAGQLAGALRDPFDRLIGAQALTMGAAVVTNDVAFSGLGVDVLWYGGSHSTWIFRYRHRFTRCVASGRPESTAAASTAHWSRTACHRLPPVRASHATRA